MNNQLCYNPLKNNYTFEPNKDKSVLKLGDLTFRTQKKINLFHRIMFRILLGVKIERINNGKKTI